MRRLLPPKPDLHHVIVGNLARRHAPCSVLWTAGDGINDLTAVFGLLRHEVLPKPFAKRQFLDKLDSLTTDSRN